MKAQLLTKEHQISSLLKGLPLEKLPPFFIADLPKALLFHLERERERERVF